MSNGGFYGSLSELQGVSAWWKETAQTHIRFSSHSLLLNIALKLNQVKPNCYYP